MQKPRLFITGINGKIGGILRAGLANAYDIWGLDIASPFSDAVSDVSIDDYDQVLDAFQRAAPFSTLIHLAADPDPEAAWESVLPNNIVGSRNVFEAAREVGVKQVIFASSSHVTGAYEGFDPALYLHKEADELPDPQPISVSDPVRPDSDYGVSKAFGEGLARYYASRWDISTICLRIGVVLADDIPLGHPWFKRGWLSHRDLVQLVRCSMASAVDFGIYYGMSNNTNGFWDISNARLELGYDPLDDAADYWESP